MVILSLLNEDKTGVKKPNSDIHVGMGVKLPVLHERADRTGGSGRDLKLNNLEPVSIGGRRIATNALEMIKKKQAQKCRSFQLFE